MTKFERELQDLKTWDEVQFTTKLTYCQDYDFINTAGHGYLIIPKNDPYYQEAEKICQYGFKGDLACYLEEDCEVSKFLDLIN